jgi:hypothetical protein
VKTAYASPGLRALLLCIAILPAMRAQTSTQDGAAQAPPPATVSFSFVRVGLPVPKFTLTVSADGTGTYKGEEAPPPSPYPGVSTTPAPIDRGFTLSAATTGKIFSLAHELHNFNTVCASKARNIADTGTKTLTYSGSDGGGACTYNFSENKNVQAITEMFLGIAATMDEGRRLDRLHRYDRLGLDAAIGFLAEQVSQGRALELGTIQTSLRSIADDADVIQRVRTRAVALLALVPAGTGQAAP